jgi:hypothetical protein
MTFEEYIQDVKIQLECNEIEGRDGWVLYTHTNEDIDKHLNHFKDCYDVGLSAYKALLFFYDHLINLE